MVFLADGRLHMWECVVMVAFYIFYVLIVVAWHWYLKRRSEQKILETVARSHFHMPVTDDNEVEPYHDEEDENVGGARRGPSRTVSGEDFANLERAGNPMMKTVEEGADLDDETRDHYLAEISSNMRVSRPQRGERRNTTTPIRPSLVGALEFRAVLSSLQKVKNIQPDPINLRRYSDDPALVLNQQPEISRRASNPASSSQDSNAHHSASDYLLGPGQKALPNGRIRAVSSNDVAGLRNVPHIDFNMASDTGDRDPSIPGSSPWEGAPRMDDLPSPAVTLSSPQHEFGYMASSPLPMSPRERRGSADLLAPPGNFRPSLPGRSTSHLEANQHVSAPNGPAALIGLKPAVPKLLIPNSNNSSQVSSPLTPFPDFYDDPNFVPSLSRASSVRLPPPSISPESSFAHTPFQEQVEKRINWWPYKVLPAPQVLVSTLLPTIYSWHDKNIWEKMVGIVAAPSVFLLTITLPIVESDQDESEDGLVDPDPGLPTPRNDSRPALVPLASENLNQQAYLDPHNDQTHVQTRGSSGISSPVINITAPTDSNVNGALQFSPNKSTPPPLPSDFTTVASSPKEWNRWLVATQIFTAPLFVLILVYANIEPSNPRRFLLPLLITLVGCLIVFALLLLLTTPSRAPRYRYLLCFFGFVVAIAWISTIASEVVGVLKALGIILNMSDAILGLTIFAVGNSLGDLVADITVARLGYPVMALSACFGGPMLNILLGIGLSGLYMTINGSKHRHHKHPDRPLQYKPYHIEIGGTLIISGITLLVTLLGLLVVVPLRGWWMDRKVGWGLIVLWTLSTIGNVIVEVVGKGGDIS